MNISNKVNLQGGLLPWQRSSFGRPLEFTYYGEEGESLIRHISGFLSHTVISFMGIQLQ